VCNEHRKARHNVQQSQTGRVTMWRAYYGIDSIAFEEISILPLQLYNFMRT